MAHADCIGADSLEILQTPSPNFLWYNRTENSGIVMETDSFDLHPVPVQGEAFVRIECEGAESDSGFAAVNLLTIRKDVGLKCIEIWLVKVPKMRILDFQLCRDFTQACFSVIDSDGPACDKIVAGIVEAGLDFES